MSKDKKDLILSAVAIVAIVVVFGISYVAKEVPAVQTGGEGHNNPEIISGVAAVEEGLVYLSSTDTPEIGTFPEHGIVYTKPNGFIYYLYDRVGITESEMVITKGWQEYTPIVTLVGGAGNTVPEYASTTGRFSRFAETIFVDILLDGDGGNEGAGTGQINISLPSTSSSQVISQNGWMNLGTYSNGADEYMLYGTIDASSNQIELSYFEKTGIIPISNMIDVTGADQDDPERAIRSHFWYEITREEL